MDPQYGAYYRRLYETHWWWRMRERWVLQAIRRAAPPGGWRHILDIGCGDGLFFDPLQSFGDVEGLEPDANLVSASNPYRPRITIAAFDSGFQPGKRYGLILMLDVLEHLSDPQSALRHVASLLENHGTLILTVPAYKLAWTNHDVINHHVTRFRKATLFPLINSANLRVAESDYWFHWTFPVKLAQRATEAFLGLRPKNPSIPASLVNRMLSAVSSFDHAVLTPLHFPFGTTLFVRMRRVSG